MKVIRMAVQKRRERDKEIRLKKKKIENYIEQKRKMRVILKGKQKETVKRKVEEFRN